MKQSLTRDSACEGLLLCSSVLVVLVVLLQFVAVPLVLLFMLVLLVLAVLHCDLHPEATTQCEMFV